MRVASLDLGTNTFLLLVAEWSSDGQVQVIEDRLTVVRLGEGLARSGRIGPAALGRARDCLSDYMNLCKQLQVERIYAVSTSAARDAANGAEFLAIGRQLGFDITILTGDQEAQATLLGVGDATSSDQIVVVDVGGGSTEIVGRDGLGKIVGASIDVGAVRLTEMFLTQHPCRADEVHKLDEFIRAQIEHQRGRLPKKFSQALAVAGTPTSLVTLIEERPFSECQVEGYTLKVSELWGWRERLAALSIPEREALPGMPSGRSDVLVAGISILAHVAEALGAASLKVSTRGVRFGVIRLFARGQS